MDHLISSLYNCHSHLSMLHVAPMTYQQKVAIFRVSGLVQAPRESKKYGYCKVSESEVLDFVVLRPEDLLICDIHNYIICSLCIYIYILYFFILFLFFFLSGKLSTDHLSPSPQISSDFRSPRKTTRGSTVGNSAKRVSQGASGFKGGFQVPPVFEAESWPKKMVWATKRRNVFCFSWIPPGLLVKQFLGDVFLKRNISSLDPFIILISDPLRSLRAWGVSCSKRSCWYIRRSQKHHRVEWAKINIKQSLFSALASLQNVLAYCQHVFVSASETNSVHEPNVLVFFMGI